MASRNHFPGTLPSTHKNPANGQYVNTTETRQFLESKIASLTTDISYLAHLYYQTGVSYHSLTYPCPCLRLEFSVSSHRELPDLITLFGVLENLLQNSRAALGYGDVGRALRQMWEANVLMCEAREKVFELEMMVADAQGRGQQEDAEVAFGRWMGALPDICGEF